MSKGFSCFFRGAAVTLICGILIYQPVRAARSQIEAVGEDIRELEEKKEQQEQELNQLQENKAILDSELSGLNQELSDLAEELGSLEAELLQKEEDILLTKEELEAARAYEETQYELMKKRIRFFYEKGDMTLLEALLEAESFTDFLNRSMYVQSIHEYDRNMLAEYRQAAEEIQNREDMLIAEQQELAALARLQQEKMDEVQVLLAEVQGNLATANQQISNVQGELEAAKARLKQQKALEQELEEQKAAEEEQQKPDRDEGSQEEALPPPVISDSASDLAMLAAIIECESGNQSFESKLAVGSVVMNRVRSPLFPNTVLEVLYQKGQFSPVASGRFAETLSRGAEASCVEAARSVLAGNITLDKLFFKRNDGTVDGIVIGVQVFY